MSHASPKTQTFADQPHTGLLVALWLDAETASQMAVSGGEPAEKLHVTLCYVPDATDWDELTTARAIAAVDRAVSWAPVLTGKVGGYGRFSASETSDAQEVFYASVDMPRLNDLRESVTMELREAGIGPSEVHGYTPHITLAYLDPDADNPVDRLPATPLRFTAVTIRIGDETRIDIPLNGDTAAVFAMRDDDSDMLHVFQAIDFAEPPEWSPFLPVPGTYSHPVYGTLDFSPDTYGRILDNFTSGIYQDRLPVNTEHDPHAAGAVGWITDMRLAETGAIEAKVDWNDRGRKLIEGDRYKYVSAEYLSSWVDPVDPEQRYQDVAVGLALTTRPYFKPRVLPPLAASEAMLVRTAGDAGKEHAVGTTEKPIDQSQPAATQPVQLSEAEVTAFRQFQEAGGLSVLTELSEAKTGLANAESKIATMEHTGLVKRFTDEVRGRSDENGTPWVGDIQAHVNHAVKLAETFGEDSDEVKHYVATNRAHTTQLKESGLFSVVGSGGGTESPKSAWDRIQAKAKQFAEDNGVSRAEGVKHVLETDPDLATAYTKER